MAGDKYLHIYLSDHLAGSAIGIEVAKRAIRANADNDIGHHLRQTLAQIEEDRRTLEQVMELVGAPVRRWKLGAAWAAEKVGRLKLNGEITNYSPLSRLTELEALSLGIRGKRAMWQSLREIGDPRLASIDFDSLIERADKQYEDLELQRRKATALAFGSG